MTSLRQLSFKNFRMERVATADPIDKLLIIRLSVMYKEWPVVSKHKRIPPVKVLKRKLDWDSRVRRSSSPQNEVHSWPLGMHPGNFRKFTRIGWNPVNYRKFSGCMPYKVRVAIIHGTYLNFTPAVDLWETPGGAWNRLIFRNYPAIPCPSNWFSFGLNLPRAKRDQWFIILDRLTGKYDPSVGSESIKSLAL